MSAARRTSSLVGITVAVVAALLGFVPTAQAGSTAQCSGSFCVWFGHGQRDALAPGNWTSAAGQPVNLSVFVGNSGSDLWANQPRWLKQVTLKLGDATTAGPSVTAPSALPAGTLVAGTVAPAATCLPGADGSGYATSCPAGYGHLYVSLTGLKVGNGIRDGSYGITQIVSSATAFNATLDVFVPNVPVTGSNLHTTLTIPITVTRAGRATTLTMPTTQNLNPVGLGPKAVVDSALTSLHMQLNGRATQTSVGTSLATPATVLALPTTCGDSPGSETATARSGATVSESWVYTTTGCPQAMQGAYALPVPGQPGAVTFASAPVSNPVSGRITTAVWSFGDGTTGTTDPANSAVTHVYPSSTARTVTVHTQDSLGLVGPVTTLHFAGSALTASAPTGTSIVGALTDSAGTALAATSVSAFACPAADSALSSCLATDDGVTDALGHYTLNAAPSGAPRFFAVAYDGQPGDDARIGTLARTWMKGQPTVGLRPSAKRIHQGKKVTLSGSVAPAQTGSVLIQRYKSGHWSTVATRTLSGSSAYSWTTKCGTKGTFKYRTVRNATATTFAATSATIAVKVV